MMSQIASMSFWISGIILGLTGMWGGGGTCSAERVHKSPLERQYGAAV